MNIRPCIVRGERRWRIETTVNGIRQRQFFRDKEDALEALASMRQQRAQLGEVFDLMTPVRKAQVMEILAQMEEAGTSLERVWNSYRATPRRAGCNLADALAEMLSAKAAANCRPRHLQNLRWYLGRFIAGREKSDVSTVTDSMVAAWFTARNEKPIARKTHMTLLSIFFNWCLRRRYLTENPITRLDRVKLDRHSPQVLTAEQSSQCLAWIVANAPEFLAWFSLAIFCGLRPDAECDLLEWSEIDLERGRLIVTKSKVRSRVRIADLAFCPPALPWLRYARAVNARLPVPFSTRRRYARALRDHLKLARWPQDVLRHTAASNLLALHQDAGKVAAFLGNSAGVLLRDYHSLTFREDAEKFMALRPPTTPQSPQSAVACP